jgi:hypothetical protein
MPEGKPPLAGCVALVLGGAQDAVAAQLEAAGAAVYQGARRDTEVDEAGVAVEIHGLVTRIAAEQGGRLDVVVHTGWGGGQSPPRARLYLPYRGLDSAMRMLQAVVADHETAWRLTLPLMADRGRGLVVEVAAGSGATAHHDASFEDLVNSLVVRRAAERAAQLRRYGIAVVAVTPDAREQQAPGRGTGPAARRGSRRLVEPAPDLLGRVVAALAADPAVMARSGQGPTVLRLAQEYGLAAAGPAAGPAACPWPSRCEPAAPAQRPTGDPAPPPE